MWPFRRREDVSSTNTPSGPDDYYRTERRERVGLAWLLALASLIATILIALALFYGVRFIYHKIHHNSSSTTTSTATGTASESGASETNTSQGNSGGQTNAPGSATTSTPSTTTPGSSSTSGSTNIANTGPGSTIGIFVAVSTLGAVAHSLYTRRKVSQEL